MREGGNYDAHCRAVLSREPPATLAACNLFSHVSTTVAPLLCISNDLDEHDTVTAPVFKLLLPLLLQHLPSFVCTLISSGRWVFEVGIQSSGRRKRQFS